MLGVAILRMRGEQPQRLRVLAMGERDAGIGRARDGGGDAWDDFERDAVRAQHFEFFAAAAEHEGIAALQPHHALAGRGVFDQQVMDACLGGVVVAADALADLDQLGVAMRQRQHIGADQAVVEDHVGLGERARGMQGEQARIAGAGTHQAHNADRRRIGNRNGRRT